MKKITRKRPNNWRPKDAAQRKEAAAKQGYTDAYNAHRAKGGAPPRTPPWLIRSSETNKWTLHEDPKPGKYAKIWGGHIEAPSATPSPLVPAVRKVARALNAPISGAARAAGLAEKKKATAAKYQPLISALERLGVDLSTERSFDKGRKQALARAMRSSGIKPWSSIPVAVTKDRPKELHTFVRWLQGRAS